MHEKSHENILIYDISYKSVIGPKLLRMYYLVLLGPEKYDSIYNGIRHLISLKSGVTYIFSHYFAKTKVYSYYPLPIEKILT